MKKKEVDPAIERVRAARHAISASCDHDARKLVAYYMKRAEERKLLSPKKEV